MFHLVARSTRHTLLFRSWSEGLRLWSAVVGAAPGLEALCLMPDHLHLIHPTDVRIRLAAALSGYTRWRNAARGEQGLAFQRMPVPEPLADDDKLRRSVRYVHLNPVRARLTRDPLEWPLCTHRDRTGLAAFPVVRAHPDPEWLHSYVSSDPTCRVDGTDLPGMTLQTADLVSVFHATSAVTRTSLADLQRRGPARQLFVASAIALCDDTVSQRQIADLVGLDERSVRRLAPIRDPRTRLVARATGDDRLGPLLDGDLRTLPGWGPYRRRA